MEVNHDVECRSLNNAIRYDAVLTVTSSTFNLTVINYNVLLSHIMYLKGCKCVHYIGYWKPLLVHYKMDFPIGFAYMYSDLVGCHNMLM